MWLLVCPGDAAGAVNFWPLSLSKVVRGGARCRTHVEWGEGEGEDG